MKSSKIQTIRTYFRERFGLSLTRSRNAAIMLPKQGTSSVYFRKWLILGTIIGIVAGLGAIVFYSMIVFSSHIFLGLGAGYIPPGPAGEGKTIVTGIVRPWAIPIMTTLGGLITGILVFTFAPEAEGHGTDSAIDAFHNKNGFIRPRVPLIKTIASAITIGSGGSAGREGPTAQIAAGFGSILANAWGLDERDRRIAMAVGVGSGIGAIFKAPFGGALLSAEVLYKDDLESEVLFPSFIASVVGYTIFGSWAGWTPVFGFGTGNAFTRPITLIGFGILGIASGLIGLLYPRALYGVRDVFKKIPVPNQLKPALGGLIVGLIGMAFPQALSAGYGYVQLLLNNINSMPILLISAIIFIKIFLTSMTIGSGGSGGVFGPGMVIGGFIGAATWTVLHSFMPGMIDVPGAFIVVGMGAFFGGVAKAPLAVILMVVEMTGDYSLIVPAILATMIAVLVTGEVSIYEKQVSTRSDSPAHKDDYMIPYLQQIFVADVMQHDVYRAAPQTTIAVIEELFTESSFRSIPITDGDHLLGIVTTDDLGRAGKRDKNESVDVIMTRNVITVYPDETLDTAWLKMTRSGFKHLPVVQHDDPQHVIGEVTLAEIGLILQPRELLHHISEPISKQVQQKIAVHKLD